MNIKYDEIIKFNKANNASIKVGDKVIFDFELTPRRNQYFRLFQDGIFKVLTAKGKPIASFLAHQTSWYDWFGGPKPTASTCKALCDSTDFFISAIIDFNRNNEFKIVVRPTKKGIMTGDSNFRQAEWDEKKLDSAFIFNSGLFSYYRIGGKYSSDCNDLILKGFRNSGTKQEFLNFHEENIETFWHKFVGGGSYYVKGIAPRTFKNNEYLKEVDAEFYYVGQESFSGCNNLKRVKISTSYCHSQSFKNCFNLKEVSGIITFISDEAFENCHNLESVSIRCRYISDEAFMNCSKLQNVELNCTYNDQHTIDKKKVEGFSWIGKSSFEGCVGLSTIDLRASSITIISKRAFANCKNLKTILLPETVNSVDEEAFLNCESLEEIHFPKSMFHIKENAFANCVNLRSVSFGREIVHIFKDAFYNCNNLTEVHVFGRCHKNQDENFKKCFKKNKPSWKK